MISETERNYQCRNWEPVEDIPLDSPSLSAMELYRFCNTDSQAFKDLIALGRGEQAILLDYELTNLGFDPSCGSMITKDSQNKLYLTIFTEDGSVSFIQA